MARYILKRLLWIIPVVLGVTIMVFTIMYLTPGDPARMILGSNATEEKVEELHEQLGMNGNYFQRLGRYMKQVFIDHDLGSSYYTGVRVTDQIKARLPFTLRIAGISILIAACIGIPLGVLAATHHYTWIDNLAMFGILVCIDSGFFFCNQAWMAAGRGNPKLDRIHPSLCFRRNRWSGWTGKADALKYA